MEPRPSFIRKLHDAELFVLMGMDLEIGWALVLIRSARNAAVQPGSRGYLDASVAIVPLEVPAATVDRSMGDVHLYGNPHYLTDPINGVRVARLIRDRLSALDPASREAFAANTRAFEEVRTYGAAVGSKRSEDQSNLAAFWYELSDIGWNRIARVVAHQQPQDLAERARLFALLNVAMADGYIAGWDSKYHYDFWRPYTAIREAARDGNAATDADVTWEPAMPTPPVQDHPSTHSALGDAAAAVLASVFGDDVAFTVESTSADPAHAMRSFTSFSAADPYQGWYSAIISPFMITGSVAVSAFASSMVFTSKMNRPRQSPVASPNGPAITSLPSAASRSMFAKCPLNIASRSGPLGTGVGPVLRMTSTYERMPRSSAPSSAEPLGCGTSKVMSPASRALPREVSSACSASSAAPAAARRGARTIQRAPVASLTTTTSKSPSAWGLRNTS